MGSNVKQMQTERKKGLPDAQGSSLLQPTEMISVLQGSVHCV